MAHLENVWTVLRIPASLRRSIVLIFFHPAPLLGTAFQTSGRIRIRIRSTSFLLVRMMFNDSSLADIFTVYCSVNPISFFCCLAPYRYLLFRDDPNSRQNTIKQIVERSEPDGDWQQVLIFPEGTCTNRSCLITFRTGAFLPGVTVQPVLIRLKTVFTMS